MSSCHFVPPYLLDAIASAHVDADLARCGHATLAVDEGLRSRRLTPPPMVEGVPQTVTLAEEDAWTVHTAANGSELPGSPVRSAGEPVSGDAAVDEAYAGVEASVALFAEVFGRTSYDGRGAPVIATVHYERNYDNAFWDGRQLVLGDGDGRVFDRFTKPVEVLAHEFVHAVTQYTAGLAYQGESGALNESMSDVFAACVKQRLRGQTAAEADWLIGEGLFLPGVAARGLRSMAAPGTAYEDPVIGRDPQVGHMASYVDTTEDNGGVHLNSGIPNRAFHLVATRLGGYSWERAGRLWFGALTSSAVGPDTGFAEFARATVAAAGDDRGLRDVVGRAWAEVGVLESAAAGGAAGVPAGAGTQGGVGAAGGEAGAEDVVEVTRSGGFAGRTVHAAVSTTGEDPRAAEVRALVSRIDLGAVHPSPPQPDRYVYSFAVGHAVVRVHEQDLTPDLSRLAALVLDDL